MSYKFNRNCWVESLQEDLFCAGRGQMEEGVNPEGGVNCRTTALPNEKGTKPDRASAPSIEEKIASAERLFAKWGDVLKQDERIGKLILRLETNLENSRRNMHELGISKACARCDENASEGSCCSQGLEKKYSPALLLMNLMLGAVLPGWRLRAGSCYFLGIAGCVLKARDILCVDYLCPELEELLGRDSLIRIQTVSGEEIVTAFLLQEAVVQAIRKRSIVAVSS